MDVLLICMSLVIALPRHVIRIFPTHVERNEKAVFGSVQVCRSYGFGDTDAEHWSLQAIGRRACFDSVCEAVVAEAIVEVRKKLEKAIMSLSV